MEQKLILDSTLEYVETSNHETTIDKLIGDVKPEGDHTVNHTTIDGQFSHKNYMGYLERCYDKHMGYVISPELIWYVLLSEIAGHIKENSEQYRDMFTDSDEKKDISVECHDVNQLPQLLVGKLKDVIPTEIGVYLPNFTTETPESIFACSTAFCDAVSPYYDYFMYCCGLPSVVVKGTEGDWNKVKNHFAWIARTLKLDSHYTWVVTSRLKQIRESLDDIESYKDFYRDVFKLERCGSGGQVEASGWLTELYMKIPSTRYTHNFNTQVSQLRYKNLTDEKDYMFSTGIMKSNYDAEAGVSIPEFGHILFEFTKEK
jgi:hypothetical protein